MHVDVLKVPHHGSSNNLDDDFFERIIADHYVFSGDGEHGNPERETLEMLFKARGDDRLHDPSDLSDRRDRQATQGGLEEGAEQGEKEEEDESAIKRCGPIGRSKKTACAPSSTRTMGSRTKWKSSMKRSRT